MSEPVQMFTSPECSRYHGHGPIAGFRVGILCLDTVHHLVPGNAQHAASFNFPVLYEPVKDVPVADLMSGDEKALPPILDAISRLERRGVRAIVGACGSFANYQKPVAEAAGVPVFMSVLLQVPLLLAAMPRHRKLGIVFASTRSFTAKVMEQCGIDSADRVVAIGADSLRSFAPILGQQPTCDLDALEGEVVSLAKDAAKSNPDIGAWLLQCSDLPPYAASIQAATALPVFDVCTLIEHVQRAAARSAYGPC